jgi:hypothetical protein
VLETGVLPEVLKLLDVEFGIRTPAAAAARKEE